ncbi:MAG: hypothetical protein HOE75_11055 [Chloroflexi bacterium]|nr:hypothetical protein [Chloroflexota bacterium]
MRSIMFLCGLVLGLQFVCPSVSSAEESHQNIAIHSLRRAQGNMSRRHRRMVTIQRRLKSKVAKALAMKEMVDQSKKDIDYILREGFFADKPASITRLRVLLDTDDDGWTKAIKETADLIGTRIGELEAKVKANTGRIQKVEDSLEWMVRPSLLAEVNATGGKHKLTPGITLGGGFSLRYGSWHPLLIAGGFGFGHYGDVGPEEDDVGMGVKRFTLTSLPLTWVHQNGWGITAGFQYQGDLDEEGVKGGSSYFGLLGPTYEFGSGVSANLMFMYGQRDLTYKDEVLMLGEVVEATYKDDSGSAGGAMLMVRWDLGVPDKDKK